MSECRLRDIPIGGMARVVSIGGENRAYRSKLLSMGLTRGTVVLVRRAAPFGDPIVISIRGFDLSLRKGEADAVLFERVEGNPADFGFHLPAVGAGRRFGRRLGGAGGGNGQGMGRRFGAVPGDPSAPGEPNPLGEPSGPGEPTAPGEPGGGQPELRPRRGLARFAWWRAAAPAVCPPGRRCWLERLRRRGSTP